MTDTEFKRGDRIDIWSYFQGEKSPNETPGTIKRVKIEDGVRTYFIAWDDGYIDEVPYKASEMFAVEEKE